MRMSHEWRRAGRAWVAGCATVACAAVSIGPAQVASASQGLAGPDTLAARLCHVWPGNAKQRINSAANLETELAWTLQGRGGAYD